MNSMTINTPPPMGGNSIPKSTKVPTTPTSLSRLFYHSASHTIPDTIAPTAGDANEAFRGMSNITNFGNPAWAKVTQFVATWADCPNLRDISTFCFLEGCNYDSTFLASGIESINFNQLFRNNSAYNRTFKDCKSLRNVTDPGLQDTFIILGIAHRDCFWGATNFTLPLSYNADIWIQFPDSTDIAGFLRATNALGTHDGRRIGDFRVDALYAKYANAFFWDTPIALRPQRYFDQLVIGLQHCDLADVFFGAVKVYSCIYMEYLPNPNNNPDCNHENILGNVEIIPGTTGINIYRNTAAWEPPMYDRFAASGLITAINYYGDNMWNYIRFDNLTISIAQISAIQNSTWFDPKPTAKNGYIEFNYCTFEDPEGKYTLQTPNHEVVLSTTKSTNLDILKRALTPMHSHIQAIVGG